MIEPSTDKEKPLTVIRAENGSGKTTLLRALRWAMYGEKGLPGEQRGQFSVHPASWHPDKKGVVTRVSIEFESDGSTRHDALENGACTVYQLTRSVMTFIKESTRDNEPDFRRFNEKTMLMVREAGGKWSPHTVGVDAVIERLFPWELRDFFVTDADEATDFVGGSENKVIPRSVVVAKTTAAVHSLLGINVFKDASDKVKAIAREYGAQAARAIGKTDLDQLQRELETLRENQEILKERIKACKRNESEIGDRLRYRQQDLERESQGVGQAQALSERKGKIESEYKNRKADHRDILAALAAQVESIDLLASLAGSSISETYAILRPLYQKGHIPSRHVRFVKDILDSGTCICGQDILAETAYRQNVLNRLAQSIEGEQQANYQGYLHDAVSDLASRASTNGWRRRTEKLTGQLAACRDAMSELELERLDIDEKLGRVDREKIQVIRDEIAALVTQKKSTDCQLAVDQFELAQLTPEIDSREKRIQQRTRKENAAADQRRMESTARFVASVLDRAYATIRTAQVTQLSERMNQLFAQMVANVTERDLASELRDKASLRMIASVGIRAIDEQSEEYEICAHNSRHRAMPPIEINGAARRVLALSFVLALCIESNTRAPLIADSLLNFMSGSVRKNTLQITATSSSQPILLLTGADLEGASEIEIVERYGGATYTLTGQWDAIEAGRGGDVVNWTVPRLVSIACACGPRQYCRTCERTGQAERPGWEKRS